jgi:hypothetical protein
VKQHLLGWDNGNSPWISLHVNWQEALDRARYYENCGEENVEIMIIDLSEASWSKILDAEYLAEDVGLSDPSDHADEILIYGCINGLAVLPTIPATGGTMDVPTDLHDGGGVLRVPVGLMEETNGQSDGAVEEWLAEELSSPCICDPGDDLIERIMKEMCI